MNSAMTTPEVEVILGKLRKVSKTGSGWQACCPCRDDDNNPTLTVGLGNEDRVLLNCHRGNPCNIDEILDSLNLTMVDLFPTKQETQKSKPKRRHVEDYDYQDADGSLIFQVQRFVDENGKKTFTQRRPDEGGGWTYSTQGVPKPLYRLPQVLAAKSNDGIIFVVEGEKDVHALERLGCTATCNPGGAGGPGQRKWTDLHTQTLAGAKVVVCADNDEPGEIHARHVAEELTKVEAKVKVVRPPKHSKDVADLLGKGGELADLVPLDDDSPQDAFEEFYQELAGLDGDVEAKFRKAQMLLEARNIPDDADRGRLVHWSSFLKEDADDAYDWLIPNLLERQERVIVVAAEGVGKTVLARQVALMSAAGIHPFKRDAMPPIRTLMFDFENPERIIRRTSRKIHHSIKMFKKSQEVDAHLVIKPDGVNLLAAPDRALIVEYVESIRPDLVLLGPIYKSFIDPGGRTAESISVEVAKFLDMIRSEYNCALWLEHHAPLGSGSHRDLRPFGSAVWSRWSEFGIALHPDPTAPGLVEVRHYRGMRDEREWPTGLKRGEQWPFEATGFTSMPTNP